MVVVVVVPWRKIHISWSVSSGLSNFFFNGFNCCCCVQKLIICTAILHESLIDVPNKDLLFLNTDVFFFFFFAPPAE